MTGIPTGLLASADKFIATATNLVKLIEKNVDAGFRIAKKVRLQRDLARIREVASIFSQLMYFNGVFITEFSKEYVMSPDDADELTANRDNPVLLDFQETLDQLDQTFDKSAPKIRGLSADLVVLFKEGIALRRKILADYLSGKLDTVSRAEIDATRKKFLNIYTLEERLWELERKLETKAR
jgi:hypothetical protein